MSDSNIIITGAFRFPNKDAAAQRVLGIARALRYNNINTVFCGWENSSRKEDLKDDGIYKFDGFDYYSQSELDLYSSSLFQKIYNFLRRGTKTIRWIKNYCKVNNITAIVIYNSNSYFIYRLYRYCKKNKIKFACDCTEWYEGSHLPGGKFGIPNFDNNLRIRIIYPLIKNVIVISSFLQNTLRLKGCNTIIVPPLINVHDTMWATNSLDHTIVASGKVKLIYVGIPGKKDLLSNIFTTIDSINKGSEKIIFSLVGIDINFVKKNFYSGNTEIPSYINCHGCVNHENVPELYRQSDFSIILRDNKRYANAGFPTKLVESLTCGIPVISNSTSDIPKFIVNRENGYLLPDNSITSLNRCFTELLTLTKDEIKHMKTKAKESSICNFDIRIYSDLILNYFQNLV